MKRLVLIVTIWLLSSLAWSAAEDAAVEEFTLDNGLTVILRPSDAAQQTAMLVLYRLGGDHDGEGKSGRAHLVEHLYVTSAATKTPARTMNEFLRAYPLGWNAQTGFDATVFAQVFAPGSLGEEIADAAARMSDLKITQADLEREVPRAVDELQNMYERIPALMGLNHARSRLYPIAAGGRHGGSVEHIRALTVAELQETWRQYYRPNNAILVLAGGFDLAETRKIVEETFGQIAKGKEPPEPVARPQKETGTTVRLKAQAAGAPMEGVVCLAFAAPQPGTEQYPAFLVVVARLWAGVPFVPGQLAPVYYPVIDDPSTIALQAPLPRGGDANAVLKVLQERLAAALGAPVTSVDKTQAINAAAMLGTVDIPVAMNPYGVAFGLARCRQLGIDGKALRSQIESVTTDDVKTLSDTVFSEKNRVVVIVDAP